MANPSPFEFFEAFYPGTLLKGRLPLYTTTLRTGTTRNYWCFNLREADRRCSKFRNSRQVFFGPALHSAETALPIAKSRRGAAELRNIRGCEASATVLPALWVEIPYANSTANIAGRTLLPPDIRHALYLLKAITQRPSIVTSGGGKIQAFWLLEQPWLFDLEDKQAADKAEAKALLRRLWWAIACPAAEKGWNVDIASAEHAGGLAAAFPVPNSPTGRRAKGPRTALETFPLISGDARYHQRDFEYLPESPEATAAPWQEVLEPPASIRPATQTHSLAPIVRGCGWLGHCYTDRATLEKEELELATKLLRRCYAPGANSAKLIHTLHSEHPGYDPFDVDRKIAAAQRAPDGPITCPKIGRAPGVIDRFCSVCPHFGQIDTPYELALEGQALVTGQGANHPPADTSTAHGSWPDLPDLELTRAESARLSTSGPDAELESQTAELLAGLETLLLSLGGAATARQLTSALASEPKSSPQLAAALPRLIPDFDPGAPRAAGALGYHLRGLKDRVFGGRALVETCRVRDGIAWAIRPASPTTPLPANDPKEEDAT